MSTTRGEVTKKGGNDGIDHAPGLSLSHCLERGCWCWIDVAGRHPLSRMLDDARLRHLGSGAAQPCTMEGGLERRGAQTTRSVALGASQGSVAEGRDQLQSRRCMDRGHQGRWPHSWSLREGILATSSERGDNGVVACCNQGISPLLFHLIHSSLPSTTTGIEPVGLLKWG